MEEVNLLKDWTDCRPIILDDDRLCLVAPNVPAWVVIGHSDYELVVREMSGGALSPSEASVLRSISERLRAPLIRTEPAPQTPRLYIELTQLCNLACAHCYNCSGAQQPAPLLSLPLRVVQDLLLEAVNMGVQSVTFSGGEPLLYDGCHDLLACAQRLRLRATVATNGTLIDLEQARRLSQTQPNITVSLDGACAETHDALRGGSQFARTITGIENLRTMGFAGKLTISTVLNRLNRLELEEIVTLCREYKVGALQLIFISRQGRAIENWSRLSLSRSELAGLCIHTFELQQRNIGALRIEEETVSTALAALLSGGRNGDYACSACQQLKIDATGVVHPCAFFSDKTHRLGDIHTTGSLKEVLRGATRVIGELKSAQYRRADKVKQVADCPWREYCGGGCMAHALINTGSIWGVGGLCCDVAHELYVHIIRTLSHRRTSYA